MTFFFQKVVNYSMLWQGFTIPSSHKALLQSILGDRFPRGEKRTITIFIDGMPYQADLKNQVFDATKYSNHKDVIQIRYNKLSPLALRLREIFHATLDYITDIKALPESANRKIKILPPQGQQELLMLYATDQPNVFMAEYVTADEKQALTTEFSHLDELQFETEMNESFTLRTDPSSTIREVTRLQRVRCLDRSIGDTLKQYYNFTCQMTGERIGANYGVTVVEAHHILPFTESMNNDTSNLIILSPNFHRIIHRAQPVFDRKKLCFIFPNGLEEKVKINKHL